MINISKKIKYNTLNLFDLLMLNEVVISCPIVFDDNIKTDYYVTNYGDIYSIKKDGRIKILKQTTDKAGYKYVNLRVKQDGKTHDVKLLVHRLVAMAFIATIPNKLEVNHKNGDKNNNQVNNLEWVDHSENMIHAYENDLNHKGENNSQSVYSNEQIHHVCKMLEENKNTKTEISIKTGVAIFTIDSILRNKKWKHISSLYDISRYNVKAKNTGSIPKFTNEQIHDVCKLLEDKKYTTREINKLTGVNYYTICDIRKHKSWKSISKQYNF